MRKVHIIQSLRDFRRYHKVVGILISFFIFISALTGIFLALKKQSDWIQPPTQKGATKELSNWLPIDSIAFLATQAFQAQHPSEGNVRIDRIDVRPSKGIAKVLLDQGWWEVQIDGQSGAVKSIARRHSDWIEALHDGSIISETFKLISMNLLGFGLLLMTITGLWLWYGPKYFRKYKQKNP